MLRRFSSAAFSATARNAVCLSSSPSSLLLRPQRRFNVTSENNNNGGGEKVSSEQKPDSAAFSAAAADGSGKTTDTPASEVVKGKEETQSRQDHAGYGLNAKGEVIKVDGYGLPMENLIEEVSRATMKAEGREGHVKSRDHSEDTSYPPILARGKKNVYDYTDDIPKHVKPMYHWSMYQQREYFQAKRDPEPWWRFILKCTAGVLLATFVAGAVIITRIWLEQPKEVLALRNEILQSSFGRVLELGAGQGANVGLYPYPVHEIVMVDQNAQQLQRLRYRLPKTTYPKYEVRHMKTEKLDEFKDQEFDCIIDMFGLCHYKDPVMALRQMQRLVKPTGTILLLEHGRTPYFVVNKILDFFSDRHTVNTHGCRWNLPMREYFKEARLEIKEYRTMHYGTTHYVIAYPEVLEGVTSIVDQDKNVAHAVPAAA